MIDHFILVIVQETIIAKALFCNYNINNERKFFEIHLWVSCDTFSPTNNK